MNETIPAHTLRYVLAFIAVLAGVAIPLRTSGVAPEQAALGLALIGSVYLIICTPNSRIWFKQSFATPQAKLVSIVFVAWAVTIFFSPAPVASLKMAIRTGLFLVGSIAIGSVLYRQHDAQHLLWKTLIVASVVFAVITLVSLLGVPMIGTILKGRWVESAAPTIDLFKPFGASVLCLTPVVTWAGYKLGRQWWWAGFVFTPLAVSIIFMTNNRSALAGFMAMAIVTALVVIVAKHRYVRVLLGVVAAITFGVIARVYTKETNAHDIANLYLPSWLIDPHRQNIWRFSYERFLEHPWVGNGIDQLNRLPGAKEHVPGLAQSAALVPSHPHNWSLEILSETGIIGFTPVLIALGFVAWRLMKRYFTTHDEADLACLALMAAFWSSALFNFSIWASWWQLTFFVLFAIVSCSRERQT